MIFINCSPAEKGRVLRAFSLKQVLQFHYLDSHAWYLFDFSLWTVQPHSPQSEQMYTVTTG